PTVKRSTGDLADNPIQFSATTGARHPGPPDVVIEVDFAVLQPHRTGQLERDVDESVTQRFQQVQAAVQNAAEPIEAVITLEIGGVDDRHLQGVHVHVGCLAAQKHGIPAAESLHSRPHSQTTPPRRAVSLYYLFCPGQQAASVKLVE